MKFHHARLGLSAVAAATLLSACVMSATGSVTPGQIGGSASPGASMSPGATSSATPNPNASATAKPSASPSAASSASPSASASPATGGKTGDAEPNDDFATASAGAWDTPISGTAGAGDEKGDYYKIDVPAGTQDGWLVVDLTESHEDYAPAIELFKANKAQSGATDYAESGTADPSEAKWQVKAGNSYYVKLSPQAGDETVDYTVTFKFVPVADPNERNDTFETATALALGTATKFASFWALDATDDKDYFKVTLPAGKARFRVALTNATTNDDAGAYRFSFFKADKSSATGTIYGEAQADITGDDGLSGDLAPGEYFILVEGDNTDAISEFTVTAEDAATEE